jgi:HK97 family phage major capsid protein
MSKKRKLKTRKASQPERSAETESNYPDLLIRAATIEVRAGENEGDAKQIRMSVSSEEPVLTYVYFNESYQRAYEILDHSSTSIDMARCSEGLVVLDRHYGDQIGLMQVKVSDKKLGGPVDFCTGQRAQDLSADAAKGLRRNISVGYQVDSESYRLEDTRDGIPVVRAMSWTPYEASFEPVPADTTVGVGRSANAAKVNPPEKPAQERNEIMDPKEMAKLFARAAKYGIDTAKVEALIADGKGRAELDALIVERQEEKAVELRSEITTLKERKPEDEKPEKAERSVVPPIGGDKATEEKAMRKYSVMNVLRSIAGGKADIGFEREISDECGKQRGKPASGIIIPHAALGTRDFTKAGTSSSSIATNLLAGEFIDLLRTKTILAPLGVRFLTGLVGDVAIPKMSAGTTGYWVTEGNDITESQPTLGQVTGDPHTCGVMVDISRRLLNQSTPDAENMVRDELIARIARTIQIAVFAGTGADGQPSAITAASGINNPSVTEGTPTYAELLGFISDIMTDNAEADGQKWAMTAEVWAKLAATFIDSSSNAERVLDWKSKTCLGHGYEVSEDVGANSLFFGNFSTVNVGVWGNGVDVNADTATLSASGGLRLVGLQDVDVMVRLGQALAYNSAVTA